MNIYQILIPSQFLPKLAGAAPFSLSRNSMKFSVFGQFWQFALLSTIASLLYVNRGKIPTNFEHINTGLAAGSVLMKILLVTYGMAKECQYQQVIVDFAASIDDYDKRTGYNKNTSCKREGEKIRYWSIGYMFVLVIFSACRLSFWNVRIANVEIMNEICAMHIDNSILMFSVLVAILGTRLRHFYSKLLEDRSIEVQDSDSSKSLSNPLYIRELYAHLTLTGEKLNDHYAPRLLSWAARLFVSLVSSSYFATTTKNISLLHILAMLSHVVPIVVGVLVFCQAGQFANDHSDTALALLEQNMRPTTHRPTTHHQTELPQKEMFLLILHMLVQPFIITANGFFRVDLTLPYEIFTGASTYLALCLQTGDVWTPPAPPPRRVQLPWRPPTRRPTPRTSRQTPRPRPIPKGIPTINPRPIPKGIPTINPRPMPSTSRPPTQRPMPSTSRPPTQRPMPSTSRPQTNVNKKNQ